MTAMQSVNSGRRRSASTVGDRSGPRVVLFGDSHSDAVRRAIEKRIGKGQPVPIAAHRLRKEKYGRQIGDTSFEEFLELVAQLGPEDVALSMIGGNQHAVFSTIQHPQRFDFFTPDEPASAEEEAEIIPYRAVADVFVDGLRHGDGKALKAIREATQARFVHVIPPPPKEDNGFIEKHHETFFARENISALGVSSPSLRLKFWKLQTRILRRMCKKLSVEVLMPPRVTIEPAGFLRPAYYADDATHANWRYGERILREIEKRFIRPQEAIRASK